MRTCLAALFLVSGLLTPQVSAAEVCLDTDRDGSNMYFKNNCSYDVTVAYCTTEYPSSGKFCNDRDSDVNPYYTHMRAMRPGEGFSIYNAGNVNYAVCRGFINGWNDPDHKFSSSPNGNYSC